MSGWCTLYSTLIWFPWFADMHPTKKVSQFLSSAIGPLSSVSTPQWMWENQLTCTCCIFKDNRRLFFIRYVFKLITKGILTRFTEVIFRHIQWLRFCGSSKKFSLELFNNRTKSTKWSVHGQKELHCKKSWRSSSTPASGDAGPIHTGEKILL